MIGALLAICLADPHGCVVVDPTRMSFSAYRAGRLVRTGKAVSGRPRCVEDTRKSCRTPRGLHTVSAVFGRGKRSRIYPLDCTDHRRCGARMYYYMRFGPNGEGLHGSDQMGANANVSHGCVRLHTADARWLRLNLVRPGVKVLIRPY